MTVNLDKPAVQAAFKHHKSSAKDVPKDVQNQIGSIEVDGGEYLEKKKRKEKKDKKGKKKADDPSPIDAEAAEAQQETGAGKKEKKKEKKKRVAEDVAAANSEAMVVDEPAAGPSSPKEEKKKKKRKREQDFVPRDDTIEPSEKKKKRKTDPSKESLQVPTPAEASALATEAASLASSSSKKSKKAKRSKKVEADASTAEAASVTPSSSTSIPSPEDSKAFLQKHSITIHSSSPVIPIVSFGQLDIPERLKEAFAGFKEPTPIQACAWPPALDGKDVVGIAETGSGKTLAYGIPGLVSIITHSYSHAKPVVLVVAPTRELAIQIHDAVSSLGIPFGIRSVAVFGGVDKTGQIKALQQDKKKAKEGAPTTRIVVGTPGRILDLVNDRVLDLSEVHYLVLDEADRMLDKGFENDIRKIIGFTKDGSERQTLMFSATWPDAVRRLASSFQRDPVRVTVGSDDLTANSRVEQAVEVFDDSRSKDSRLLGHLRTLIPKKSSHSTSDVTRILVFALYKKEAARVEGMLRSKGFSVGGLHGDMQQKARMEALDRFKTGETPLLVATDVAARGLDIPNVAAVINYTFPLTIEDYIHRIGRTGRGGKSGKSITFFTGDAHERSLAGELARVLRESGFESEELKEKFPMTIKKKTHSAYGAFFRDDIATPAQPTKIVF